jgi:hypothetical protein
VGCDPSKRPSWPVVIRRTTRGQPSFERGGLSQLPNDMGTVGQVRTSSPEICEPKSANRVAGPTGAERSDEPALPCRYWPGVDWGLLPSGPPRLGYVAHLATFTPGQGGACRTRNRKEFASRTVTTVGTPPEALVPEGAGT